jgi:hypothetical protein
MHEQAFDEILILKTDSIVNEIIKQRKLSLPDALEYLYSSQTYELLEREDTKMWYYSTQMLCYLLEKEKERGELYLPE